MISNRIHEAVLGGTHYVKSKCGLIFVEDLEATFGVPAAFAMQKNSPWLDVFNPLLANTAAYVKHLEDKYVSPCYFEPPTPHPS